MSLTGVGCRLQTCSRLASERFDSAFCAPYFDELDARVLGQDGDYMSSAEGKQSASGTRASQIQQHKQVNYVHKYVEYNCINLHVLLSNYFLDINYFVPGSKESTVVDQLKPFITPFPFCGGPKSFFCLLVTSSNNSFLDKGIENHVVHVLW